MVVNDRTQTEFYQTELNRTQINCLEQCTQTGSNAVHPFSAACLVILCAFLKSTVCQLEFVHGPFGKKSELFY